ncbi:MAG: hypothetical protein CMQ30_02265 [Gammaproteobacteria bacterium]|nr:hypothetical protein [Gammaproteobacteria bacterium]|tara:strand:+ start:864 stop:1160 length:297 start_codon:yes stop_codon:yes gene_type:complete
MYYAIICEDQENSLSKRTQSRPAHIQRLHELKKQDRILIAGPHPAIDSEDPGKKGFVGSLIVAEFHSLEQAEQWAREDPYVDAGVYKKVTVKPFKKVF